MTRIGKSEKASVEKSVARMYMVSIIPASLKEVLNLNPLKSMFFKSAVQ